MTIIYIQWWYGFTFTSKIMKKQGGRCICTGLHLMCIAQAHSLGSYFILPLAWPSSNSHCIPVTITTTVSHPDYK